MKELIANLQTHTASPTPPRSVADPSPVDPLCQRPRPGTSASAGSGAVRAVTDGPVYRRAEVKEGQGPKGDAPSGIYSDIVAGGGNEVTTYEADEANRRLLVSAAPSFDEFLILRFRATNEPPYPFEWVDEENLRMEYAAALTRISSRYEQRF